MYFLEWFLLLNSPCIASTENLIPYLISLDIVPQLLYANNNMSPVYGSNAPRERIVPNTTNAVSSDVNTYAQTEIYMLAFSLTIKRKAQNVVTEKPKFSRPNFIQLRHALSRK